MDRRQFLSLAAAAGVNFIPSLSQIPDVNLSIHPARATARRLPPSIVHRAPPAAGRPTAVDPIQCR
jgi:hypothetical protein